MSKRKVNTVFSEEDTDNTNFKKILISVIVLLTVTALVLLTVFLTNYFGTYHLTVEAGGGVLINNRTNVTYTLVSPCPYMVNLALDEVYAEADGVKYYKIVYIDDSGEEKFFDPEKMIATVDEYRNVDLYLAEGFTLPTFNEISPTHGRAYYVQVEELSAGTLSKTATETVVTLLKERENSFTPSDVKENSRLNLYLIDPAYPHFWYTVEYFETESGDKYVRDRVLGKCIKATEELSTIFGTGEGED